MNHQNLPWFLVKLNYIQDDKQYFSRIFVHNLNPAYVRQ